MIKHLLRYQVDESTGETIPSNHTKRLQILQRTAFKYFEDLKELSLANVKSLESKTNLTQWFDKLQQKTLRDLCVKLELLEPISDMEEEEEQGESKEHLVTLLANTFAHVPSPLLSIYTPVTEEHVWNDSYPSWKMTLQNISVEDYLVRNFELFLLEQKYVFFETLTF
jgi:hypothetical protein